MKRWGIGFLLVLLSCLPIYFNAGTGQGLLQDTDTAVLLKTVRARHDPLSWFAGDWPLENHFYRPLPTLAFEMDNALYGDNAAGYGRTNAFLAIVCVLLLFWFFREFTDKAVLSTLSSMLFAFWVSGDWAPTVSGFLYWAALASLGYFLYMAVAWLIKSPSQDRKDIVKARLKTSLLASLTFLYASNEVNGGLVTSIGELPQRMIGWLPGRTASVMTVFALLALAAYARYERVGAPKVEKEPSPLDRPNTRNTGAGGPQSTVGNLGRAWIWGGVAVIAVALAFASYEQSVMLPAVLLGTAIALRMQGYRVRWAWQAPFWLLLAGYILLRKELLPAGVSQYQHQQLRFGPGVHLAIMSFLFPTFDAFLGWVQTLSQGFLVLFIPGSFVVPINFVANITAFVQARRHLVFALAGWALSSIAFLPMAWLKPFEHYDFWPMAMRSIFAVTLGWTAFELLFSAVKPPALQAPPRPDPAPGSLPHP